MSIRDDAAAIGLDPDLAEAVMGQESGGDPTAVSPKGAQGEMQVMPGTAAEMQAKGAKTNKQQGALYLKERLDSFKDLPPEQAQKFALAAYNAGPGRVQHSQAKAKLRGLDPSNYDHVSQFLPKETRDYVPGVLRRIGRGTSVTPGRGVASVTSTDPEAELDAMIAGGQGGPATATGTTTASSPEDELNGMIQGGAGEPTRATQQPRSLAENATSRVPGLQGYVDLAKFLGHVTGVRPMSDEEYKSMTSRGEQMLEHPIATDLGAAANIAGTALAPWATALGAGAGIATEAATGSKTAGDVAEIATPFAPAVGKLAAGVARGGAALRGGANLAEEVAGDIGGTTDAVTAGKVLQGKGEGARAAITNVAEKGSTLYQDAQKVADKAGLTHPASDKSLVKAAGQARRDTAAAGGSIPGGPKKVMNNVLRLRGSAKKTSGMPSGARDIVPGEAAASTAAKDTPVSALLEQQSNLRREISQLPYNHPARRPLMDFDKAIEDSMDRAAQSNPEFSTALDAARENYRTVTAPTKKTAGAIARAETPEAATRRLTSGNQPSRFERIASAEPAAAEPVRGAFWNDAITKATKSDGTFDLAGFAKRIPKDKTQLAQMADTPAKKMTVKAVQTAVRQQRGLTNLGSILGAGAGAHIAGVGGGIGGYFGMHQILKAAMGSEPVARALYRVAKARAGSPGYKMAVDAIKKAMGQGAAAATGAVGRQNAA